MRNPFRYYNSSPQLIRLVVRRAGGVARMARFLPPAPVELWGFDRCSFYRGDEEGRKTRKRGHGDWPHGHSSIWQPSTRKSPSNVTRRATSSPSLSLPRTARPDCNSSRLRAVEIGVDQDGDAITSCVVDAVAAPLWRASPKPPPGKNGLSFQSPQRNALGALEMAAADQGLRNPSNR